MKRTIKFFLSLQKQDAFAFWLSLAMAVSAIVLGDIVAPIYYSQYTRRIAENSAFSIVYNVAIIYILTVITRMILWRIGQYFLTIVENRSMEKIAQFSANHLLSLSMDFYKDNFVGSLVGKHNKLTRAYERMYDETFFSLVPSIVIFVCIVPVLMIKMPIIGIAMVIIGVLFAIMTIRFSQWIQGYNNELAAADSKVTGVISDQLSNIATIHSFGKITEEQERFSYYNKQRSQKRKNAWLRGYGQWSANDVFQMIMSVAAVLITLYYWEKKIFTLSEVILVTSYMTSLANRISNIGNVIKNLKQSESDAEEMIQILDIKPSIIDNQKLSIPKDGDIIIDNIVFSYPKSDPTFNNFTLSIKQGEKIGIVGSSGSGKTTLINLLMRQMDVNNGEISIGGVNIKEVSLRELRHNISLVAQESSLFHRSILDNIRYAVPEASHEEVESAAKKAQAYDFIMNTKEAFQTKVGERGVKLSGGQRQRIALARAFLANRQIMILDEATSSLDSITELAIQKAIDEMLKGQNTMICIAHRLSTVIKMDRIIVMDHGKIIEQGSHTELLARNGVYAKLVNAQELHGLLKNADTVKSIPRYFLGIFP